MKISVRAFALVFALTILSLSPLSAAPSLIRMVEIPGGTFTMGKTAEGPSSSDDRPHPVTIGSFLIGATEVTQKQFEQIMGFNPSSTKGADFPVENLTWFDAVAFCNSLSLSEGLKPAYTITAATRKGDHIIEAEVSCDWSANGYRLPTEAEWEYAAKAGASGQKMTYSGSSDVEEVAWYEKNSGLTIHPVGGKKPNALGLFDMSGNVWEWCWDWYGDYPTEAQTDPHGASFDYMNPYRVQRGGSCKDRADYSAASFRFGTGTYYAAETFGLRVVRTKPR